MFNLSVFDQLELGSSPNDEDCVQVSRDGLYQEAMLAECRRYKEMLQQRFPDWELYNVNFKVASNPHDFGTYYEVVVRYDTANELSSEFAYFVEDNLPATWDDDAVLKFVPDGNYLKGD